MLRRRVPRARGSSAGNVPSSLLVIARRRSQRYAGSPRPVGPMSDPLPEPHRGTAADDIAAAEPVLRRVLAPRLHDAALVDDLVQMLWSDCCRHASGSTQTGWLPMRP